MKALMRILLNQGAEGGGGGGGGNPSLLGGTSGASSGGTSTSWLSSLPEDLRGEASLKTIPDVPTLAKNYVHAQRMIGTDKIPAPQKTWNEKDWGDFWNKIGRPETHDKYKTPEVQFKGDLKFDEAKLGKFWQQAHQMGLTQDQASKVLSYYAETLNENFQSQQDLQLQSINQATETLKKEWGDSFEAKVDTAKSVLQKFGGEELRQYIDQNGMGNDPHLIKLLAKIGDAMLEDTDRPGSAVLGVKDSTAAMAEIGKLSADKEFWNTLNDKTSLGHADALARWTELHKIAYPGRQGN